ncbi:MAG: SpoIIE family protein phosphatase [Candidatus Magnetominusculus sp. LBB02]|nr:SpoIIE family protein phosphatase [Candidatus Magnetominusculus sp. LBB02]
MAENIADVMAILRIDKSINMVLIDHDILDADAAIMVEEIKDEYNIPVVLLTADNITEAASKVRVSDYIPKPVRDFAELQRSLLNVLQRHSASSKAGKSGNLVCKIDERHNERQSDIVMAKKIQQEYMMNVEQCQKAFADRGMSFSACSQAPLEISGDFFYTKNNSKACSLLLGDTSGHGLSAALQSIRVHSFLEKLSPPTRHPSEAMDAVNTIAVDSMAVSNSEISNAIALMIAVFNGEKVYISNGAQPYPLLLSEKKIEEIQVPGFPVGVSMFKQWEEVDYDWLPGNIFLAYTDGLIDAINNRQELYGRQRLFDCVDKNMGQTGAELIVSIMNDVDLWRGEVPLPDDITIVAVENGSA